MHFGCPQKVLSILCGFVEQPSSVQLDGCVADSLPTITRDLLGSQWSVLLLAMQDTRSEVLKVYPKFTMKFIWMT